MVDLIGVRNTSSDWHGLFEGIQIFTKGNSTKNESLYYRTNYEKLIVPDFKKNEFVNPIKKQPVLGFNTFIKFLEEERRLRKSRIDLT